MPQWIKALIYCLFTLVPGAGAAADPLDDVAVLISELDPRAQSQLLQLQSSNYGNASQSWQLRWHALMCEQAANTDNTDEIYAQIQQLTRLGEGVPSAATVTTFCKANLASANHQTEQVIDYYQQLLSRHIWNDDALQALALMRLGLAYADLDQHSKSLRYLSQAIHLSKNQPQGEWLHANKAVLHFALARTFSYTNNASRANEAMQHALTLTRVDSPLEWFLRFNYAVMLVEFDQHDAAMSQLKQLPTNKPLMGPNDLGYTEMHLARIVRFDDAKQATTHINSAIAAFISSDNKIGLAQSYTVSGQLKLELGDAEGWQQLDKAKKLNNSAGLTETVADIERWSATFLAKQGNYQDAYQALQQYTTIKKQALSEQQEQALDQQQTELGQEMDRHRQRLATTAEAHYQDQQSLLLWRSYGLGLTILLFLSLGVHLRRQKRKRQTVEIDNSPKAQFSHAIQQAKESGDAMPVVLVRLNEQQVDEERLRHQVNNELRPQDSWLRLSKQDFVVLLPWASDAELHWRFNTLPEYLANVGVEEYQIGRARLHSFDDMRSLLIRLECSLTRHDLRQRPQSVSA